MFDYSYAGSTKLVWLCNPSYLEGTKPYGGRVVMNSIANTDYLGIGFCGYSFMELICGARVDSCSVLTKYVYK